MVNQSCYKGLIGKVSQKAGNSTPTGGGGGGGGGGDGGGDGGGGRVILSTGTSD